MKKRLISWLLVLCLVVSLFPMSGFAASDDAEEVDWSQGKVPEQIGTLILIRNTDQLGWLSTKVAEGNSFHGYTVELRADLDMTDVGWGGIGYNLNNYFSGTFDGRNHTIRNLSASGSVNSFSILNAPRHTIGLFGVCNGATIKNLFLDNVSFSITNESGYSNSYSSIDGTCVFGGAVAGYAVDSVFQNIIVRNASIRVRTEGESAKARGGGICGYASGCSFAHCINANGSVQGITTSIVDVAMAGGLVGEWVNGDTMRQCYNSSTVLGTASSSTAYVGGLVGKSTSTSGTLSSIRDCYNTAQVQHSSQMMEDAYVGGLLGYSSSTVNRCYNAGSVVVTSGGYVGDKYTAGIAAGGISTSSVTNSAVVCSKITGGNNAAIAPTGTKQNNLIYNGLSTDSSAKRYAIASFYGSELYENETGWDFSYIWRAKADDFPELQYRNADQEEDIRLVDEAAQQIEILFAKGERCDHVLSDVSYTASPNTATVTWSSSNEAVVSSTTGAVARQEQDYLVRVTAEISSGSYSVQKKFLLNVLGTSEAAAPIAVDSEVSADEARTLIAMMRGVKFKDVPANDPDVLVLIGADPDLDRLEDILVDIMKFLEVPEESAWLKSQMGDVIGLIKSKNTDAINSMIQDFSDDLVEWDEDSDAPEVKKETIIKNLIKIPKKLIGISVDFKDGYEKVLNLSKLELKNDPLDTALDSAGKLGAVIDYFHSAGKSIGDDDSSSSISCSKIVNLAKNIKLSVDIYDAYQKTERNALRTYVVLYLKNRANFDSADDPIFQAIMDTNAATIIRKDVDDLNAMAENLYVLNQKFGGEIPERYKITISCPVDVCVYDSTGQIVGRVVNNVVDETIPNSLLITVGGENNDVKTIYVEDPDRYSISLIGFDAGTMRVEVEHTGEDHVQTSSYSEILLADGKTMTFDVSQEDAKTGALEPIYLIENGLETEIEQEKDGQTDTYALTVYPCLEDSDGTLAFTTEGGFCEDGFYAAGTELRALVQVEDGYIFEGFYTDAACEQRCQSAVTGAEELTLYAKFRVNTSGISITEQPSGAEYYLNDAAEALRVAAEGGGTLQYQWYRFTDSKADAQKIEGAASARFVPDTAEEGTVWYFVRITGRSGGAEISIDSEAVMVRVAKKTLIASGDCGDDLRWTIDLDGVLHVTGDGALSDYDAGAAPWASYADQITRIIVDEGVTAIGARAFSGLSKARSAVVADSVETIGAGSFSGCAALEKMTLPFVGSSRTAAGTEDAVLGHVFGTVSSGGTVQYYTLNGTSLSGYRYEIPASLKQIQITDAAQIPFGAFYNCANLTEIVLNESLGSVGEHAFCNCSGLTALTIPDEVTSIGDRCLSGCGGLTEITLPFVGSTKDAEGTSSAVFGHLFGPDSNGTTQYYAKSGTSISTTKLGIPAALQRVTLTNAEQIPFGAFSNCANLTEIRLNDGVRRVGGYAFYQCTGLNALTFPQSVEEIEEYALNGCNALTELTLPFVGANRSVNKTYDGALGYIFGRTSSADTNYYVQYSIQNGTSISGYGYAVPDSLRRVTVTDAAQIPFGAFSGLSQLAVVGLNFGIDTVETYAFNQCDGLTDVYYTGTRSQWDAISIGTNNAPLLRAELHCVEEPHICTVLWLDENGEELDRGTYAEGASEPTTDVIPVRSGTDKEVSVFCGWMLDTEDADTRVYRPRFAQIVFQNDDPTAPGAAVLGDGSGAKTVVLYSADPEAQIWYTTDGSQPVPASGTAAVYDGPFAVQETTLVRAVTVSEGAVRAAVTFRVSVPAPTELAQSVSALVGETAFSTADGTPADSAAALSGAAKIHVSLNADLTAACGELEAITVYLAVYDAQNKMIGLQRRTVNPANAELLLLTDFELPTDQTIGALKVIAMRDGMTPLMQAATLR